MGINNHIQIVLSNYKQFKNNEDGACQICSQDNEEICNAAAIEKIYEIAEHVFRTPDEIAQWLIRENMQASLHEPIQYLIEQFNETENKHAK